MLILDLFSVSLFQLLWSVRKVILELILLMKQRYDAKLFRINTEK